MEVLVGSFYEINHALLALTKLPDQLNLIRVVMVSEKTDVGVSLRFPSIYSLRVHFSSKPTGGSSSSSSSSRTRAKKHPPLDEKCMIRWNTATQLLLRRVPTCELAVKKDSWVFWAVNTISFSPMDSSTAPTSIASGLAKKGHCWSQLKCSGMVRWGKRRQVRFINRHDETDVHHDMRPQSSEGVDDGTDSDNFQEKSKEDDADVCNPDMREDSEKAVAVHARFGVGKGQKMQDQDEEVDIDEEDFEEEETKQKVAVDRTPRQKPTRVTEARRRSTLKRKSCETSRNVKNKRAKRENAKTLVVTRASKNQQKTTKLPKPSIDRWSAERYKLAEKNMLKILKENGAVYGNPISRSLLRQEARKLIGDTGLLDHLLKHMAGKVAPGGSERFRRRHNSDGAMEYWLESADLVNLRKEAGVHDPYWTPPPGWRPGDSPSQDPVCAREIRFLREEVFKLKGEVEELRSKKQGEISPVTVIIKPTDQEKNGQSLPVKEIYAELMRKKSATEEQLKEISKYLKIVKLMQEDMESLRMTVQETNATELEEPITPAGAEAVGKGKDGVALADDDSVAAIIPVRKDDTLEESMRRTRKAAEGKAARIKRLRSGLRICKPQSSGPKTALMPSSSSFAPHENAQAVGGLLAAPGQPSDKCYPPRCHQHYQLSDGPIAASLQLTSSLELQAERHALCLSTENPEMTKQKSPDDNATATEGAVGVGSGIISPEKRLRPLIQLEQHSKEGVSEDKRATIDLNKLPISIPSHTAAASLTYRRRHRTIGMANTTSVAISTPKSITRG